MNKGDCTMRIPNFFVIKCFGIFWVISYSQLSFGDGWYRDTYTYPASTVHYATGYEFSGGLIWSEMATTEHSTIYTGTVTTDILVDDWDYHDKTCNADLNASSWIERFYWSGSNPPNQSWDWFGTADHCCSVSAEDLALFRDEAKSIVTVKIKTIAVDDEDSSGDQEASAIKKDNQYGISFSLAGIVFTWNTGSTNPDTEGTTASCSSHQTTTGTGYYYRKSIIDKATAQSYVHAYAGASNTYLNIRFRLPNS
jgi:hypothetical protein